MAEQFQNARGGYYTTYTCPSGSTALILGITVKLNSTGTMYVALSNNDIYSVSLPAGTHNLTHYTGKITLASGENLSVNGGYYTVISALRLY